MDCNHLEALVSHDDRGTNWSPPFSFVLISLSEVLYYSYFLLIFNKFAHYQKNLWRGREIKLCS